MDLGTKLNYAKQHVESISRHDDMDADVRRAALDELHNHIEREKLLIAQRVDEKIRAVLPAVDILEEPGGDA